MEKQAKYLNLFNPGQALNDHLLVYVVDGKVGEDVGRIMAGPDSHGMICVSWTQDLGLFTPAEAQKYLRMAPLCWCEGRPVYFGERLWRKDGQSTTPMIVSSFDGRFVVGAGMTYTNGGEISKENSRMYPRNMTWAKPKTKCVGWVNVYPRPCLSGIFHTSDVFPSEDAAKASRGDGCIATVRVEFEG